MTKLVWKSEDGHSRLYSGESLDWLNSLPANSIDCIWTDPPYLLSNDGITCIAGKMVKVNKGEWDRSRGIELDHQFNRTWLKACRRVLKPAGTIWVSGTLHVYLSVGMAMMEEGFRILNDIVWEKPAPPPNLGCRCFTHSTEILLWATKAKKASKDRYTFNYEVMKQENRGKQMKNVWRVRDKGVDAIVSDGEVTSLWQMKTPSLDEKKHGKHPTQKPVALVARCLRASTNMGDLVVDPFTGSGTTGVAALQLGRNFLGCEREEKYLRVAIKRLSKPSEIPKEEIEDKVSDEPNLFSGFSKAAYSDC
jgi:site-specific DNA-methyltransferase (adenine-specific)